MAGGKAKLGRRPKQPSSIQSLGRRWGGWAGLVAVLAAALFAWQHFNAAATAKAASDGPPDDPQARLAATLLNELPPTSSPPPVLPVGQTAAALRQEVKQLPAEHVVATQGDLQLLGGALLPRAGTSAMFTRVDGSALGFQDLPLPRWYAAMQPGANQFAPLAVGDVYGNGWPDVAVGTPYGVFLYINLGGRFALQQIDYPAMRSWLITAVALEDLEGSGRPDLVFCAWMQGCHVLFNRDGDFSQAASVDLPRSKEIAVQALAFADLDRTGRLDIVTGASTYLEWNFSPQNDVDFIWHNDGAGRFTPQALPGPPGETISLFTGQITGLSQQTVFVGNDFDEPDLFITRQQGGWRTLSSGRSPFPYTTTSTMSLDSADIENNGNPVIYEAQIALNGADPNNASEQLATPDQSCTEFTDQREAQDCSELGLFESIVTAARDEGDVSHCSDLPSPDQQRDCVAIGYYWNEALVNLPNRGALRPPALALCRKVPPDFTLFIDVCRAAMADPLDYGVAWKNYPDLMRQVANSNLLLMPSGSSYRDVTKQFGVGFGGWTWNAQFADLTNDTWQDLFLTQGTRLRYRNYSNILYVNQQGKRFSDETQQYGLGDHVPTGGSVFLDLNQDGRLDVLTYPFQLTPVLWRNDLAAGPGFELTLDDRKAANRAAVGARVIIRSRDGRMQMRDIKASGGYESFNMPAADFGLGDWQAVTSIQVIWPDGTTSSLSGLTLGAGRYTLTRGA